MEVIRVAEPHPSNMIIVKQNGLSIQTGLEGQLFSCRDFLQAIADYFTLWIPYFNFQCETKAA